jgi:hypothetical protein
VPFVEDPYYQEALSNADAYFDLAYFAAAGLAFAGAIFLMLERRLQLQNKLAAAGIASVVVMSAFVVPVGAGLQQEPVKEAALLCREHGLEPILFRFNAPSFSVYRGGPSASRDPLPGDVVLTKAKRLKQLPYANYDVLYSKNGIVLIRIRT